MQPFIHFFNEIGMLAHIPRSGYAFLGAGKQAMKWYAAVQNRLETKLGKEFAEKILLTPTDQWWLEGMEKNSEI